VDLVIATRFPSYLIRHPNKVVWLIHQFRQAYDLLGTRHSSFTGSDEDRRVLEMIRAMDGRGLGEARALFANAGNTASRLERFNNLRAEALYPPPKLFDRLREGPFEGFVFSVGRLDPLKRVDLLVRGLAHAPREVRARIAGVGPDRDKLERLAVKVGVQDRVDWLGMIGDEQLIEELSRALAVFYAPYDEDFGYVTVEAFRAGKPLLTARDSGGVLEFAVDGRNGFVVNPRDPAALGRAIASLYRDPNLARTMGLKGREAVAHLSWDHVIEKLTGRTSIG